MKLLIGIFVFILTIPFSVDAAYMPKPTKTKYFVSLGAVFTMERGRGVFYNMTYGRRKPIEKVMFGVIEFQNPEDIKNPHVVEIRVAPGTKDVLVNSPVIPRIKNNKVYRVEFNLYEDEEHKILINKHVQKVLFSFPEGFPEQFGIEILGRV